MNVKIKELLSELPAELQEQLKGASTQEEAMAILYPDIGDFSQYYNKYAFRNLDSETMDYLNTLWETLKIS